MHKRPKTNKEFYCYTYASHEQPNGKQDKWCLMQNFTFILLVLYSLWSVTSVRLRRGSRAYFRIECCIGGESMAASRVNLFHTPPTNVEHEAGQAANTIFQAFCTTSLEIKPRLPAPVARAQPTVPHRLHETIVKSIQCQLYNSIYHIF